MRRPPDPQELLLEGRLLIDRALEAGLVLDRLVGTAAALEDFSQRWGQGFMMEEEDAAGMEARAGYPFHRGILAWGPRPALARRPRDPLPPGRTLVLPRLGDPANLGAILRSARALGWGRILLGPGCPDLWSPRVLRASMGAVFGLEIHCGGPDLLGRWVGDEDLTVVAADSGPGTADLEDRAPDLQARPALGLCLGHEFEGVPPGWRERCDEAVRIPMAEGHDSLNVATAAGILLYRLGRL